MGKSTGWESTLKTNYLLADIYDILQAINANLVGIGGKRLKIKPYPRPTDEEKNKKNKIGKGALPFEELKKWFKEKQNGRRI